MTPRPEFAGPAIEALRFAGHNEPLRDLYANLLATAMDADTARYAHPAFVEIVKQLSPDEAKLLVEASRLPVNELAFVTLSASVTGSTGKSIVLHRFVTLGERAGCAFPDLTSSYLNNLERLGLLEIDDTAHWVGDQADVIYKSLEDHPQVQGLRQNIESLEDRTATISRGHMRITALGRQFISATVVDRRATSDPKSAEDGSDDPGAAEGD